MLPVKVIEKLNSDSTIYQIGSSIKNYLLNNAVNIHNEINEKGLSKTLQNQSFEIQEAFNNKSKNLE